MNALRLSGRATAIAAFAVLTSASAHAQSLADRVSSGPDGAVQFSYAARPGVCGNGRSYVSVGPNTHIGSVNIVEPGAASASEIVTDVLASWGTELNRDIAQCLLSGIYGDTLGLRTDSTTSRTMRRSSGGTSSPAAMDCRIAGTAEAASFAST